MTRVSLRPRSGPASKRLPGGARPRVVDSRVDDREPVAILDQIDVDVIEPERKGKTRPQNARTNFDRFAWASADRGWETRAVSGIARFDIVWFRPLSARREPAQSSGKKRGAPIASSSPPGPRL